MKAVHRLYNNRTQNGHPGCPSDWPAAVNGPLGAGVYRLIPRDWVQAWRRYIKGDVEMERPKFDGIPADLYRCRHGLSLVPTHVLAFVGPVIGAVTPRADVMSAIGDGPVGLPSAAAPVDVPVDGNGGNYSSGGGGNRAAPVKRRRTGGGAAPRAVDVVLDDDVVPVDVDDDGAEGALVAGETLSAPGVVDGFAPSLLTDSDQSMALSEVSPCRHCSAW